MIVQNEEQTEFVLITQYFREKQNSNAVLIL